jgi:glycosyltransferase involved in cell wall biosynthesis
MEIGILGNDNNAGLLCADGIRASGHGVRLVLTRKDLVHRPEGCSIAYRNGYPEWILDASHLTDDDYSCQSPRLFEVLQFLDPCDALVLNHVGPSIAHLLCKPCCCILTGSDLSYYANFKTIEAITASWSAAFKRTAAGRLIMRARADMIARQRDGIAASLAVIYPMRGLIPDGDAILDAIGVDDSMRVFGLTSFLPWLPPPCKQNDAELKVLCGSRINWVQPMPPGMSQQDCKAIDVLVRGTGIFLRRNTQARIRLTMIEKGLHIAELKDLIREEGIASVVRWLPEAPLAEFLQMTVDHDIIVDHFGASLPGLCAYNGMAAGKPVIANFRLDLLGGHFGEPIPACHATTSEEVAQWLERLWNSPELRREIGNNATEFAHRHLSPKGFAQPLLERFDAALQGP